jgi:hypothetical protein
MPKRQEYSGWFRCAIKGRTRKYPWIYFHVGPITNKRRFRAEARIKAMNHLHRVDFLYEQVYGEDIGVLQPLPGCSGYFAKTVFGVEN